MKGLKRNLYFLFVSLIHLAFPLRSTSLLANKRPKSLDQVPNVNRRLIRIVYVDFRKKTGVGYPQLSAVLECADNAHGLSAHIISVSWTSASD